MLRRMNQSSSPMTMLRARGVLLGVASPTFAGGIASCSSLVSLSCYRFASSSRRPGKSASPKKSILGAVADSLPGTSTKAASRGKGAGGKNTNNKKSLLERMNEKNKQNGYPEIGDPSEFRFTQFLPKLFKAQFAFLKGLPPVRYIAANFTGLSIYQLFLQFCVFSYVFFLLRFQLCTYDDVREELLFYYDKIPAILPPLPVTLGEQLDNMQVTKPEDAKILGYQFSMDYLSRLYLACFIAKRTMPFQLMFVLCSYPLATRFWWLMVGLVTRPQIANKAYNSKYASMTVAEAKVTAHGIAGGAVDVAKGGMGRPGVDERAMVGEARQSSGASASAGFNKRGRGGGPSSTTTPKRPGGSSSVRSSMAPPSKKK